MRAAPKIITVGLTPVWDRTCYVDGIEWGDHKVMASSALTPAGKALNISKALAWMSIHSTVAGLWGASDAADMAEALSGFGDYIEPAFTIVEGKTRQNITVVDTKQNRELHLRSPETLITQKTLSRLSRDMKKLYDSRASIVFAGSIPQGDCQDDCIALIKKSGSECRELIVDTSGTALSKIVNQGGIEVIKPNLNELSELVGQPVKSNIKTVISTARRFCNRVRVVIVSLGRQGAVAVTKEAAFFGTIKNSRHCAVHTIGCGDYLLAGYLSAHHTQDTGQKMITGIKAAAAKAWGWTGIKSWRDVDKEIEVELTVY